MKKIKPGKQLPKRKTAPRRQARPRTDAVDAHGLGAQIRDLRRIKGVTLAGLASRIARSIGYISQVERGKSAITISALQEIADALGVQIAWFFHAQAQVPPGEAGFIVRKANRRKLDFPGTGVHEELLSPNLSGELELILTTFEPGSSTGDRDRVRRGEEAGLVLSGTLDLMVDGKRVRLAEGDSFAFTRSGPHRCANPGKEKAVVLWVITPPSY